MKKLIIIITLVLLALSPYAMAVETTITPRLNMQGEYTDNVNRTSDDAQDDFITKVSPGIALGFRGATAEMTLSYDPEYVSYRDNEQDNGWRHLGALNGYWNLSRRTSLKIGSSLIISEDPMDNEENSTLSRGRNRYAHYGGTLGMTHQFGSEDSFGLGYTYAALENEEDTLEDSQEQRPYADFTWWFVKNTYGLQLHTAYTMADFKRQDGIAASDDFNSWYGEMRLRRRFTRTFDMFLQYAHTSTDYDGGTEDYSIYNPAMGFNYVAGKETNISMALGYYVRDRDRGEDNNGIILTGDLTTEWSYPRGAVNLTVASGYRPDTFDEENLGFNYYARAVVRADYGFTKALRGDISGSYLYNHYLDVNPEREDHTYGAGCGISFQALSWMALRLDYHCQTVSSNVDEKEYVENRVWASIVLTPVNPYRFN